jgi:hypothetical protein
MPPTSHFLQVHFNIILPSMPGSPKWSLSLRSPHRSPVCTSLFPHTYYTPRPSHSSRFDCPYNIWWWVPVRNLIVLWNWKSWEVQMKCDRKGRILCPSGFAAIFFRS